MSSASLTCFLLADDADQGVHRVLEIELQRVRVLGCVAVRRPVEGMQRTLDGVVDGLFGHGRAVERSHVVRGAKPGAAAEHQQIGKRVAAEPVGAVHTARIRPPRTTRGRSPPRCQRSTSTPPIT